MVETDRLRLIIVENVKELWSPEDLENKTFSSGFFSGKEFNGLDTGYFASRFSELRKALIITKNHLADLNKTKCEFLPIDVNVRLTSFSCGYKTFVWQLSNRLIDMKPDWELYNQICLLLSLFYILSNHLDAEVTYKLIQICRQKDLFLI